MPQPNRQVHSVSVARAPAPAGAFAVSALRRARCHGVPESCGNTRYARREWLLPLMPVQKQHECFAIEKDRTRGGNTAPPGPNRAENRVFSRNNRPCGLKRNTVQTENAHGVTALPASGKPARGHIPQEPLWARSPSPWMQVQPSCTHTSDVASGSTACGAAASAGQN